MYFIVYRCIIFDENISQIKIYDEIQWKMSPVYILIMRMNSKIMLIYSQKFTFQHKNVHNRYIGIWWTIFAIYILVAQSIEIFISLAISPIIKEIIEIVPKAIIQTYIARRSDYLLITICETSVKRLTFSNDPREKNLPKRVVAKSCAYWIIYYCCSNNELFIQNSVLCLYCARACAL